MSQLLIMRRIGIHLTITPFWFEWWKLWAERDYPIPNTDCLVVRASHSSIYSSYDNVWLKFQPFFGTQCTQCTERDYRIPNTDCLVVPTPQASVGVLEHTVLNYILFLAWDVEGFLHITYYSNKTQLQKRFAEIPIFWFTCIGSNPSLDHVVFDLT